MRRYSKAPLTELMERGSFLANQLLVELYILLDAEEVLLPEGREVAEGHLSGGVGGDRLASPARPS